MQVSDLKGIFNNTRASYYISRDLKPFINEPNLTKILEFGFYHTVDGIDSFVFPVSGSYLGYTTELLNIPGIEEPCALAFRGFFRNDIKKCSIDIEEVIKNWKDTVAIHGYACPESELWSLTNKLKPIDSSLFRF